MQQQCVVMVALVAVVSLCLAQVPARVVEEELEAVLEMETEEVVAALEQMQMAVVEAAVASD